MSEAQKYFPRPLRSPAHFAIQTSIGLTQNQRITVIRTRSVRLGIQVAFGVFANAKIQCEESVSSRTPQNRTYWCICVSPVFIVSIRERFLF